jgi:hypothetical protein
MPTLIGPPMKPPDLPLMSGDNDRDIEALFSYLNDLISYLYEYRPTVEAP